MRKIAPTAAALLTAAIVPTVSVCAADCTRIGYGQGTSVDALNRPTDALQFNARYGDLDAFALSADEKRIVITFDQGYENGYTASILDTLREKNVHAIFFLTGDYAKREEALVKRMIAEGHTLGNRNEPAQVKARCRHLARLFLLACSAIRASSFMRSFSTACVQ